PQADLLSCMSQKPNAQTVVRCALPVRRCQDEKPHKRGASRIALRFRLEVAHRQCNTQTAFREHRAHTAFMSAGHPAMHEVQFPGTGVAVVTRVRLVSCALERAGSL